MGLRPEVDVAVVGAGPVGSALALMLRRAGRSTLLLDQSAFPRDKPCGEGLMPAGVRVLEAIGIDLGGFPPLAGVTYKLPVAGSVAGRFAEGATGRGVRRRAFDSTLAAAAAATPNVETAFECRVSGVTLGAGAVQVETNRGRVRARVLIGADGLRSRVARWLGWSRPPALPHRYALVGHLDAPGHGFDRIVVTLLDGCELYLAPTAADELLVALLGSKTGLRIAGESTLASYRRRVAEAHPELAGAAAGRIQGAGPFSTRPSQVAQGRAFLVGDAAGFLDPLTGEGITAGLLAAERLAVELTNDEARAAEAYRRWEAAQWRRRVLMSRIALTLTRSTRLAERALRGLNRRPAAFARLLQVNEGTRSPLSMPLTDWAALAGL